MDMEWGYNPELEYVRDIIESTGEPVEMVDDQYIHYFTYDGDPVCAGCASCMNNIACEVEDFPPQGVCAECDEGL